MIAFQLLIDQILVNFRLPEKVVTPHRKNQPIQSAITQILFLLILTNFNLKSSNQPIYNLQSSSDEMNLKRENTQLD